MAQTMYAHMNKWINKKIWDWRKFTLLNEYCTSNCSLSLPADLFWKHIVQSCRLTLLRCTGLMKFGAAWINSLWQAFPCKPPAAMCLFVYSYKPGSSLWESHIVSNVLVFGQSRIIPCESLTAYRV
jgi:hypothetical protein